MPPRDNRNKPGYASEIKEMSRVYLDEGLTLAAVGRRFGFTAQAVLYRFIQAGIPRRKQGETRDPQFASIAREILRLYTDDRMSLNKLSKRYGFSIAKIQRFLKSEGVELRGRYGYSTYPQIRSLKVGESCQVPRSPGKLSSYEIFYGPAHRAGIRISVKAHDTFVTVTRVE